MKTGTIESPYAYLCAQLAGSPVDETLSELESWWRQTGMNITRTIDRQGTPELRMFDLQGKRVDEVQTATGHQELLLHGYADGIVWRVFQQNDVLPFFERAYLHGFFDTGIVSSFTGTLQTALLIQKYGNQDLHFRFLSHLLKHDESLWQGAYWSSEIGGGSDPANNITTIATVEDGQWQINGSKFIANTPEAELALVSARLASTEPGLRNLALYVVPRQRDNGSLNFQTRRLKNKFGARTTTTAEIEFHDAEGWLVGVPEQGHEIMAEINDVGRVAHSLAAIALAQRSICEAASYASQRSAFGRPVIDQPLMRQQFRHRMSVLHAGFRLAWEPAEMLNSVWRLNPPYSDHYLLYRLLSHLAKYWSSDYAVQTARWNLEIQAGCGVMDNPDAERHLRDATTLLAVDGTSHRQILEAIKLLQKHPVCDALFDHISAYADEQGVRALRKKLNDFLHQSIARQEETAEPIIKELSWFLARALIRKPSVQGKQA